MDDELSPAIRETLPRFRLDEEQWRKEANCRGIDPDVFFPTVGADKFRRLSEAKEVCEKCQVQEECLDYALRRGIKYGVWGGMNERERRRYRRQRRLTDTA